MKYLYWGNVISDLDEIRTFVKDRVDELAPVIADEEKLLDIKLIMSELLINGVKHGNKYQAHRKINLKIKINSNNLIIKVQDEGTGFKLKLEEYNPQEMNSSGRGLVLVEGLADELRCNKNVVYVRIVL